MSYNTVKVGQDQGTALTQAPEVKGKRPVNDVEIDGAPTDNNAAQFAQGQRQNTVNINTEMNSAVVDRAVGHWAGEDNPGAATSRSRRWIVMPSHSAAMVPSSVIASAESQADAQATVDYLWARGLREGLSIVGAGLRLADTPGRGRTVARFTRLDAGRGAGLGFLMAMLITSFTETNANGLVVVMSGLLYGALFGGLRGLLRGLVRTRPEHVTQQVVATRFEVCCAPEDASVALRLLATRPEHSDAAQTEQARRTDPAYRPGRPSPASAGDDHLSDAA